MTLDLKDRLYTSSEVAEILGVSLRSVYRYIEEGKLDADIKTATGRHRFSKKNILDFLKPNETDYSRNNNTLQNNYYSSDLDLNKESNVLQTNSLKNTINDTSKDTDFDFDLDEEFLKSLSFDSNPITNNPANSFDNNKTTSNQNTDSFDDFDDLEKLLKEFEEEEQKQKNNNHTNLNDFTTDFESPFNRNLPNNDLVENSSNKKSFNDSFDDMSLDEILNSFENSLSTNNTKTTDTSYKSQNQSSFMRNEASNSNFRNDLNSRNDSNNDDLSDLDFDFNFDFDELNEASKGANDSLVKNNPAPAQQSNSKTFVEEEEDNWLERFRKAASKNNSSQSNSSFEDNNSSKSDPVSSFTGGFGINTGFNEKPLQRDSIVENNNYNNKNIENYYTSTLNDLREVAQQVDKIAKKFDTDYAFTLNAGLSLHKRIDPFTCIHLYIRERDLELFEDYLDLTPSKKQDASVCLIVTKDGEVFEDAYELHGLYVVSNVQLRSDLIDKGLDKLAREV